MSYYASVIKEVKLATFLIDTLVIAPLNDELRYAKGEHVTLICSYAIIIVLLHVACIHATVELKVKMSHDATDSGFNHDNYAAKTSTILRLK